MRARAAWLRVRAARSCAASAPPGLPLTCAAVSASCACCAGAGLWRGCASDVPAPGVLASAPVWACSPAASFCWAGWRAFSLCFPRCSLCDCAPLLGASGAGLRGSLRCALGRCACVPSLLRVRFWRSAGLRAAGGGAAGALARGCAFGGGAALRASLLRCASAVVVAPLRTSVAGLRLRPLCAGLCLWRFCLWRFCRWASAFCRWAAPCALRRWVRPFTPLSLATGLTARSGVLWAALPALVPGLRLSRPGFGRWADFCLPLGCAVRACRWADSCLPLGCASVRACRWAALAAWLWPLGCAWRLCLRTALCASSQRFWSARACRCACDSLCAVLPFWRLWRWAACWRASGLHFWALMPCAAPYAPFFGRWAAFLPLGCASVRVCRWAAPPAVWLGPLGCALASVPWAALCAPFV